MEAHYIPRIFDGDVSFVGLKKADSSKWNAIHKAVDNPGSEIEHSPSSIGSLFRVAWILGIVLGLAWIMRNGRTVFTQWQQNMYRRANRRRHGIPDSDNRPFNIAYAAAALAKKEKQRVEQEKARAQITNGSRKSSTSSLRSRQPLRSAQTSPNTFNAQTQEPQDLNTYYPINRHLPGGYPSEYQEPQQTRFLQPNARPAGERRSGQPVQLRPKGERDFIEVNLDRDVGFSGRNAPRRGVAPAISRGYKRQANDEGNWEASLDKRARVESTSHENDVESVPPPVDSEPSKGIKRDREELESTPDSGADETDESPRPRRIRQRREPVERKEVRHEAVKVHKRRHSLEESTASEERDKDDAHVSKHRRKIVMGHDTTESEAEDMKDYSEDPACVGRKIGEVWEVNGQTFKVGLDGQRLRQVLVKQRRSKFPMPKDSIHLDVITDMEVFVEKWLNDQEYKAAKENSELAWQTSPSSTPTNGTMELRQSTGKRLFWDGPPKSPAKGRKSMHASSVPNPFELVLSNASRRASSVNTLAGHAGDNPQLRTSRSFSKWEKQDLEALSLKKIRERMEKEKEDQKPAKSADKKDETPLLGGGKLNFPTIPSNVASPGPTLPSATAKQTGAAFSFGPTPATTPSTSTVPTTAPGIAPTKPALSTAESKPSPSTTPAVAPSFAFNNVGPGTSKAAVPTSSMFNFGTTQPPPSTGPTSSGTKTPSTITFPFNGPTTASIPVQGSKSEPSSSTFNFQSPTAAGSSAGKTQFNFPPTSTGPSTTTTVPPPAGTASTDPSKISFASFPKGEPVQHKATPSPGLAPTGFNFTPPMPSGSESQKNIFGNPPKPLNEPSSVAAAPSVSTTAVPPSSFNFGRNPSFSQPTPGLSTSDKPNPFAPAPAPTPATTPVTTPVTTKPADSQSSDSLFGRLGPQSSTQSITSTPSFGGFGTQATKPDQTAVKPSLAFGSKEPSEAAKATTPNMFAPTTSSGEQPKAMTSTASQPQKSIFGSQTNTNTSSSKPAFGASASAFGTPALSGPSKNIFGQPPQPVSAFGFPSQPNLASTPSSEPRNIFGQASEAKNAFGQTSQVTNAYNQPKFGQPSEPKTAFSQPNPFGKSPSTESSKSIFGQTPPSDPAKNAFGQTSTASTDAPKNMFEQGFAAAPKNVFGQPSELPKSTFGQSPTSGSIASFGNPSTSSSTGSFGNSNASTSNNTLGSSESTSNPPAAGETGFKFTFANTSGGFAPGSFAGFGNSGSDNKSNAMDQAKPTENANAFAKPTSAFGQPSAFGSFPASTSAFGSNNTPASGSFTQPSGPTTPGNSSSQPGASTSTTQTTPSQFHFNFSKTS